VQLPADLHAYFSTVNGMARHEDFTKQWDRELIRFYQLDEFQPLSEIWPNQAEPNDDQFFAFADQSIWVSATRSI
jgi:hypothetical protein